MAFVILALWPARGSGRIADPIASLMETAWEAGLRNIVLTQDTHEPDAVEFAQWPVHCVRGSEEAEAGRSIGQSAILRSNAADSEEFDPFRVEHRFERLAWRSIPKVDTFVVVGDCTDLCTYQLAMHLRLDANARQLTRRVVVPVDCVDTYDRPVPVARREGGLPHPADLLHAVFLYHMALNGVEVVSKID